jgi:hypothetical protein
MRCEAVWEKEGPRCQLVAEHDGNHVANYVNADGTGALCQWRAPD